MCLTWDRGPEFKLSLAKRRGGNHLAVPQRTPGRDHRLRELTYLGRSKVEWRSVPEPRLGGPGEALVRPVIAARCDGDNLPLFNNVTNPMRAGVALHYLDPVTTDLLGPYPYGKPFAIGHECIAEVVECGESSSSPGRFLVADVGIAATG